MIAGVVMNVLLAFVVVRRRSNVHVRRADHSIARRSARVRAVPSAPALAQLQPGDTIVAVNGTAGAQLERRRRAHRRDARARSRSTTQRGDVRRAGRRRRRAVAERRRRVASISFMPPVIGDGPPGRPRAAGRAAARATASSAIGGQPVARGRSCMERRRRVARGGPLAFDVHRARQRRTRCTSRRRRRRNAIR